MRVAKRSADGRWYTVIPGEGVCRIGPPDWSQDREGHWPRVDFEARGLGEKITCPRCGSPWVLEEMDCVFGRSRLDGNDVLVLVRCSRCRLPHRVRCLGFVTAYPRVIRLMEGWSDSEQRERDFRAEEERLYGPGE